MKTHDLPFRIICFEFVSLEALADAAAAAAAGAAWKLLTTSVNRHRGFQDATKNRTRATTEVRGYYTRISDSARI